MPFDRCSSGGRRGGKKGVEGGFLGVEGLAVEGEDGAGVVDVAEFFEDPDDGEVVVAADVDAEVKGRGVQSSRFKVQSFPRGVGRVFAGGDEVVGEEGAWSSPGWQQNSSWKDSSSGQPERMKSKYSASSMSWRGSSRGVCIGV